MSRVSCVVTETDGTTKHEYTPISIKFKAEGSKKPDTMMAYFTINNRVRQNDTIAYIHDIVSVEYLAAIWNFQLSALDERGYDLDGESFGDVNIPEDRFIDVTSGRFKGNYALNFNDSDVEVDDEVISVPNVKAITRIDLSGQFDIYVFFTPDQMEPNPGGNNPILWSFYDGTDGIEIGITDSSPVSDTRVFVRAASGGIFASITGTTQSIITGAVVLVRVYRDGDNIIHAEVNGIEDVGTSETLVGSMQPTINTTSILFGNGRGNNDEYVGQIHQVRPYIGTVLTQIQADAIRQSRPNIQPMKFAGDVWGLDDKQSYKIAKCDSFSKSFAKRRLRADDFPGDDNVFDIAPTGQSFQSILQDIVDVIDDTYTVKAKDTFESTITPDLDGNLIAEGSFLDVITFLFFASETTFYTTPRKLLIVESTAGKETDYVLDQNSVSTSYNITESDDNNTPRFNEVFFTSPITTSVIRGIFSGTTGPTYTLTRHVIQLDNTVDLDSFATRFATRLGSDNTKYVVKINTLINWLRFNQKVNIINNGKNIDEDLLISQIELEYPKSETRLLVNQNDIDFFEITNNDYSVQQSVVDSTIQ